MNRYAYTNYFTDARKDVIEEVQGEIDAPSAKAALQILHGRRIKGRVAVVNRARPENLHVQFTDSGMHGCYVELIDAE